MGRRGKGEERDGKRVREREGEGSKDGKRVRGRGGEGWQEGEREGRGGMEGQGMGLCLSSKTHKVCSIILILTMYCDLLSHHSFPILISGRTFIHACIPRDHGRYFQTPRGGRVESVRGKRSAISPPPGDGCHGEIVDDVTSESVVVVSYEDCWVEQQRERETWREGGRDGEGRWKEGERRQR